MNTEFKSNANITEVKCDSGETKVINTTDNLYDILTIENIMECLTKLKDREENNKINYNKDFKNVKLFKRITTVLSGILGITCCVEFILLFIIPSSIPDILFLGILLIALGLDIMTAKKYYNYSDFLLKKINKTNINLEYLDYKINYAKELLEEFKRNGNSINIEDRKTHKLDLEIPNIYRDQYNMFNRLSERAVDIKVEEPIWKAYEADLNQEEVEIAKNARKRVLNQKARQK